ncbi:MAG TPA: SPFH domain-containing protein [Bacteroidia bacterium]|nr:SPFH domain-containing protein [Bacteroidia bacterium]
MKLEKDYKAKPGMGYLALSLLLLAGSIAGIILLHSPLFAISIVAAVLLSLGFVVVQPNHSVVLVFFGTYKGTLKENGFWWVNPFFSKKSISLRARNLDREPVKVNDKLGNPIMIGVVLVWRVQDTYKAALEVDSYENFVKIQSESAIRQLATHFAYDKFDDEETDISLRDGGEEVNGILEETLRHRLEIAGIEVIEARIAYLAYAQEIAGAMLQRQQATAIVAARKKIVEGAVSMVEMALQQLKEKDVVQLDDAKKAAMVSNLMVVLCSDRAATPMANAGVE